MGFFTLGALRGIGNTFYEVERTKSAERAQIRAEEREAERRKTEAEDAFAREKEIVNLQNQNNMLQIGRQQYFAEVNREKEMQFQTSRDELQQEFQRRFAIEEAEIKEQAAQKARERDIIQTFGYVTDKKTGKQRLPNAAEMSAQVLKSVKDGNPMLIPQSLGTLYGFSEAIKAQNTAAGLAGGRTGVVLDREQVLGAFTVGDKTVPIYGVPDEGTGGERALRGSLAVIAQAAPHMDQIKAEYDSGNTGPGSAYQQVRTAMMGYGQTAFLDAITTSTENKTGDRVISNVLETLDVRHLFPDETTRMWVIENFIRPASSLGIDTLKRMAGIPMELSMPRDDVRNKLIIPRKETYEWATNIVNGEVKIKESVWKQASEISKYSGVPVQTVIASYAGYDNPEMALKDAKAVRGVIETSTAPQPNGKVGFTRKGKEDIRKVFEDRNLNTTEERVEFVRQNLANKGAKVPSKVRINAMGQETLVYGDRKGSYGIDNEDAQAQAISAAQVVDISRKLIMLQDAGLASPGIEGLAINVVGGLKQIGESLLKMSETYKLDPDARKTLSDSSEKLRSYMEMGIDSKIEGQALYNLLAEQLAFAMAAAFQKGEGGRAISDRDVEAQRSVLGLRALLANEAGAKKNLQYLIKEFSHIATINNRYAQAQAPLDFKATWIVDQVGNRPRSVADVLMSDKIVKMEEPPEDMVTPILGTGQVERIEIAPGFFIDAETAR